MNFQIQETLKKLILFSDENLRLETIFYRIFVNFSDYFVTICCHLFEKGIMTEQFDTKRSRLIMGKSSLSSHNHVLRTWKQNMLYRATKVDFWQAIPPLWQPHQQHAATARFYFTKWSSRSYVYNIIVDMILRLFYTNSWMVKKKQCKNRRKKLLQSFPSKVC